MNSEHRKKWTHRLIFAAKTVIWGLLVWFVWYTVVDARESLSRHSWHVEPLWLVVSGVLYLLGTVPAAFFWYRVLVRAGQDVKLGETLRSYYVSQLGKYVPGKWMVIVLRRALLYGRDIESTVVAASVFFETFTTLAVGSAVAAVVLSIWHRDKPLLIVIALGAMLITGIPTVPKVFQWLIHILGVGKLNRTTGAKLSQVALGDILLGWIGISAGWLLQGMSLWATLRALDAPVGNPFHELSMHTAAVSLAVVAGFLSQFPGGLGAREWVLKQLMQPEYGLTVAIVAMIIFRLVWLVSEVVISIILYLVGYRRLAKPLAAIEAEYDASESLESSQDYRPTRASS